MKIMNKGKLELAEAVFQAMEVNMRNIKECILTVIKDDLEMIVLHNDYEIMLEQLVEINTELDLGVDIILLPEGGSHEHYLNKKSYIILPKRGLRIKEES